MRMLLLDIRYALRSLLKNPALAITAVAWMAVGIGANTAIYTHQDHLDACAASHRAVREMKETGELPRRVKVRSSQYLNNLVEIVFTQMTKPNVLAVRMCGDYVTDLDFALGHKDPVN